MGFLPLISSNLFKQDMLIKYENCLYQMSNFKFAMQHSRRKSGVAARNRKLLHLKSWAGNKKRLTCLRFFMDFLQLSMTSCVTQGFRTLYFFNVAHE